MGVGVMRVKVKTEESENFTHWVDRGKGRPEG
jgi:hypothetical protein